MAEYIDVDVRPILRAGGEPFSVIMAALDRLGPGQGIRLYATFKPIPLFGVMADKGFAHSATALDDGEWEVLFTPALPMLADVPAGAPAFENWPEPAVKLDNRDLDPPEPMVRILAAAEKLKPGDTLSALLRREPCFCSRSLRSAAFAGSAASRRTGRPMNDRESPVMTDRLVTRIKDALRVVIDPELGQNIVDLGFIYDISVVDDVTRITMTATTPGCPAAHFLKEGVAKSAARVPGVRSVEVVMTFEPPWTPSLIEPSAASRARLRCGQLKSVDGCRRFLALPLSCGNAEIEIQQADGSPGHVIDRLRHVRRPRIESRDRRRHDRAVFCHGCHRPQMTEMQGTFSRTISTSRRRSFNWTSAARTRRLSVALPAIADSVRIEHGATIMPAVSI